MFPIDQGIAFAEGSTMNLEAPARVCKGVMPLAQSMQTGSAQGSTGYFEAARRHLSRYMAKYHFRFNWFNLRRLLPKNACTTSL